MKLQLTALVFLTAILSLVSSTAQPTAAQTQPAQPQFTFPTISAAAPQLSSPTATPTTNPSGVPTRAGSRPLSNATSPSRTPKPSLAPSQGRKALAGNDAWTGNGPGGGIISSLAIDPQTPNTIYAGTTNGVYKSTDSGTNWALMNSGLTSTAILFLAIDPKNPATIYAGGGNAVFKSTNSGGNWNAISSGLGNYGVYTLAIDPQSTSTLYAGTDNGVYKSIDGGATWSAMNSAMGVRVLSLAIDPITPTTLYGGTDIIFDGSHTYGGAIFKSTDGAATWNVIFGYTLGGSLRVDSLAIDPQAPGTVYAAIPWGGGVAKSMDYGATWNSSCFGEYCNPYVSAIAIDPQTPASVYVGTILRRDGVYKSVDGGILWNPIHNGLTSLDVEALAIDPQTPSTIYAGTVGSGVYKSTNGGTTWSATNNGLNNAYVLVLAINPQTPSITYAGSDCPQSDCFAGGIFKTTDRGVSWSAFNNGLVPENIASIAIDPQTPSTLYAGTVVNGNGIFKSTNGGTSWSAINTGLDHYPYAGIGVLALAIDPQNPITLYAGTFLFGIFKSTNGGSSWTAINSGMGATTVNALAIDPVTPIIVYAGTDSGIFKTVDGGTNWTAINNGMTGNAVKALAIDPQTRSKIYAATSLGVFKSSDSGASWTTINNGLANVSVYALLIDPQTTSTLYAGTQGGGVFKSTNAGANWSPLNTGLTVTDIRALSIDPQTPNTIYAGTYGGGVFVLNQAPDYYISGRVADGSNTGISGVTISDGTGHTATTDSNGNYTLSGLVAGTYTTTPSKTGYAFSPTSRSVTVPANATGQDFVAAQPNGSITSPSTNSTTGPASIQFTANAWEFNNGSGVKQVEFYVFYDGIWRAVDVDTTSPYQTIWQTPTNLRSQQVWFAINVLDTVGNMAYAAGGIVRVNFVESFGGNTSVNENWTSSRLYLNQRSLTGGDAKCSVASMAMVLAANGTIAPDYASMSTKANEMYPRVLNGNGDATIALMRDELRRQGAISDYYNLSANSGWTTIKQEVDAGRPVIIRTANGVLTAAGHFFIAVGYRETTTTRQVIAYDPFGHWQGTCCQNNYDVNSTDPASHKGQWVYYDFNNAFGSSNYLITAHPNTGTLSPRKVASPTTPPDVVSDEPVNISTYSGVNISTGLPIYLPFIRK